MICGVQRREGQAADAILEGDGQEHITASGDPSLYYGFCTGTALGPATTEQAEGAEAKGCYCYCPIWQAEKKRIEAGKPRAWESNSKLALPENTEDLLARVA